MRSPATTSDGVRPALAREEGPGYAEPGRRCSPAHLRSNRPAADAQSARGGREGLSYSTAKDSFDHHALVRGEPSWHVAVLEVRHLPPVRWCWRLSRRRASAPAEVR